MHIVHVFVHVKPQFIDEFKAAAIANASQSVKEPGIARFDVIQDQENPGRFVLVEVYRDAEDAPAAHKQTPHYARWRETVEHMMAEPRSYMKYHNIFPADAGW